MPWLFDPYTGEIQFIKTTGNGPGPGGGNQMVNSFTQSSNTTFTINGDGEQTILEGSPSQKSSLPSGELTIG